MSTRPLVEVTSALGTTFGLKPLADAINNSPTKSKNDLAASIIAARATRQFRDQKTKNGDEKAASAEIHRMLAAALEESGIRTSKGINLQILDDYLKSDAAGRLRQQFASMA